MAHHFGGTRQMVYHIDLDKRVVKVHICMSMIEIVLVNQLSAAAGFYSLIAH